MTIDYSTEKEKEEPRTVTDELNLIAMHYFSYLNKWAYYLKKVDIR